ncbi:hypothetical protein ACFL6C_14350 [Myxococcota bacterium]
MLKAVLTVASLSLLAACGRSETRVDIRDAASNAAVNDQQNLLACDSLDAEACGERQDCMLVYMELAMWIEGCESEDPPDICDKLLNGFCLPRGDGGDDGTGGCSVIRSDGTTEEIPCPEDPGPDQVGSGSTDSNDDNNAGEYGADDNPPPEVVACEELGAQACEARDDCMLVFADMWPQQCELDNPPDPDFCDQLINGFCTPVGNGTGNTMGCGIVYPDGTSEEIPCPEVPEPTDPENPPTDTPAL